MLLTLFLIAIGFLSAYGENLESKRVTQWGTWTPWTDCPTGSFAYGFRLKSEAYGLTKDNTGLNAVYLYCSKPTGLKERDAIEINGGEGSFGIKGNLFACKPGAWLVGFQLYQQPDQGKFFDDMAAANMNGVCSDNTVLEGDGQKKVKKASWNPSIPDKCHNGGVVCGLRSQIEQKGKGKLSFGDDTSLNNVDMKCCPNPA